MAFLFAEGFDKYNTTGVVTTALGYFWNTVTLGNQLTIQTGRDFDYSLFFDGDTIRKTMTPSGKHFITFSLQSSSGFSNFYCRFGTGNYVVFYYDSMNGYYTMDSYFGGSSSNHGNIGDLNSWKTIELVLDPSGATANLCYVDEINVMSRTASFTHGNYVEFASDNSAGSYFWYLDHIGCWDSSTSITNARLGKTYRVKNIKPSADSTPEEWIAVGEADAYNCVDNVPLDVTKYIKALTDNDKIEMTWSNLTGTPPVIAGVQFQAIALNTDATTKNLIFLMDSSGTPTEIGSASTPGASLTGKLSVHGPNPITTNAWTYTEVNDLLAGVKRKA